MPEIDSSARKHLRGLAHALKPIVQVGASGVTESVVNQVDEALTHHELIKVRLLDPEDKKADAKSLADLTRSSLCGLIGHTVILYRAHPSDPKIRLPKS